MLEGIKPCERSHEQEVDISRRSAQFLGQESLCSPSYEGLKVLSSHICLGKRCMRCQHIYVWQRKYHSPTQIRLANTFKPS